MVSDPVMTPPTATLTFSVVAGRLVAGQIERELRRVAFEQHLTIAIEKLSGLLEVTMLVTVIGPSVPVVSYQMSVSQWARQFADQSG